MARPQTPQGSLRQRPLNTKKSAEFRNIATPEQPEVDKYAKAASQKKAAAPGELEYYIGLLVTTILAFITRFWGISHPNEVVFDEVHFGKVR